MNASATTDFKRELEALATLRDELKLKAHLAKKDLQDELDRLETKWLSVDEELQRAKAHAKGDLQSIGKSTRDLLLDLKQGYESIRRKMTT
jgi:hypothetical protein